ncbi:Outer membrane lipoprotein-sorting protein [Leeuwenhoekiella marinoflava DSM 3653]|uniref:Outer membrane lipoprotein-sorting protein n=3 Tax=Leeuwenhoekiella marinoflava TaxID=988 RepID=A0A4Q0PLX8_9FLAO|nr:outer membrane lipoprotein-sorting protein [Leeuwenhoekiella marinoflava]SHF19241.1 Outer membrane lipoprotein-sorting protein [Leeuwenhoekiella marinoflava DSM 3653]
MKFSKIKVLTLMLIACTGASTLFAQDAKAKKLLDEVSAKVKTYDNMYIDFKYGLSNDAAGINQETRGDVTLYGDKYKLNLMGTTQMYDGKKLYTIIPEDEEITISTQDPGDDDAITPSKMLTFFNEGYTYKWDIEQNVNGRKIQYVKLTPMDSNSELKSALLGIDAQTKHIYRLIMTQNNGSKITITVNSFKTDKPLPDNMFVFDENKYGDYYINRLD